MSGNAKSFGLGALVLALAAGGLAPVAFAQDGPPGARGGGGGGDERKPDFPPFAEVSKDFTKVVSTADGEGSLWTLYTRERDGAMLAELPREFARQKYMFGMTIAAGEPYAGLQGPDMYLYWKRYDKRLALIEPQITNRSTGDQESKSGVERAFTDRVLVDIPIVAMGPGGGPVIDLKGLFAGQAGRFFGMGGFMTTGAAGANPGLATIKKAKAFPQNIEVAFEMPTAGGVLKTFYYSVAIIPDSTGYQPRVSDERIGYFGTWFRDLGKFKDEEKWVRYINRWHFEKSDPKLRMSPPKKPLVYYVEHTVPSRYRRFVRDGALWWNKAFEKVGLTDAIEVYYQDKATGQHMDKDPEDARYNFIRWVVNDVGTAIGPSRTHPLTGQILDADVVLTDGWIRHFWSQTNEIIPDIAMRSIPTESHAWLDANPNWDPRLRMASPERREQILAERATQKAAGLSRGVARFGGRAVGDPNTIEAGFLSQRRQATGYDCMLAEGKSVEMSIAGMSLELLDLLESDDPPADAPASKGEKKKDEDKGDFIDGIPEWFVGLALADLTAHEVGHTLGLRHNFKASSAYTLAQINSPEFKGKKPYVTSVMDYTPMNLQIGEGKFQGDYNVIGIGPYDMWAIEYGYTFSDPKDVLKRVAEPELQFGSDEDADTGIDPTIRRYDFAADPIEYAKSRIDLAKFSRGRIIEKFVKPGQSWSRARRGYSLTLNMQMDAIGVMSNWVGTAFVYRDRKGDPNGRPPINVVPVEKQREALKFVCEQAFREESFGLTPDLLAYLTADRRDDPGGGRAGPEWAVHDQIGGMQAAAITQLMNPAKLRRILDNEVRTPKEKDALTLVELFDTVTGAIWTELESKSGGSYTVRNPMISSLRRNLQREHLERLIDLSLPGALPGEAAKAVSNLAVAKLRELKSKIDSAAKTGGVDPYSVAHLGEASKRIEKALDAQYVYNQSGGGGGPPIIIIQGEQPQDGTKPDGENWQR